MAVTHGATSRELVVRRATVEKRRMLRRLGLRQSQLESVGIAYLGNWARCAAALTMLDRWADQAGWLDGAGEPRGFTKLYASLLNAELRALRAFEAHLRKRGDHDVVERLYEGLAER